PAPRPPRPSVPTRRSPELLPGLSRLRDWAHQALALRPGETAVDIGSGTGSEVITFAEAVGPTGTALGVEPDPHLLAAAERNAAQDRKSTRLNSSHVQMSYG